MAEKPRSAYGCLLALLILAIVGWVILRSGLIGSHAQGIYLRNLAATEASRVAQGEASCAEARARIFEVGAEMRLGLEEGMILCERGKTEVEIRFSLMAPADFLVYTYERRLSGMVSVPIPPEENTCPVAHFEHALDSPDGSMLVTVTDSDGKFRTSSTGSTCVTVDGCPSRRYIREKEAEEWSSLETVGPRAGYLTYDFRPDHPDQTIEVTVTNQDGEMLFRATGPVCVRRIDPLEEHPARGGQP